MNLKTLGLTISLVGVGWLGVSEAASAAPKFKDGDLLNLTLPSFQINAAGLQVNGVAFPVLPTGEVSGGADGNADALFGNFNTNVPLFETDRVINKVGGTDFVPGDLGHFKVEESENGFNAYSGQIGSIRSFDGATFNELNEVNGGFNPPIIGDNTANEAPDNAPGNFLLTVGSPNQAVYFYLTEVVSFNLENALSNGFGQLSAKGFLLAEGDDEKVDYYSVTYNLSSQFLIDGGPESGSDVVAGDGVTGAVSASGGSLVIEINEQAETTPEPSAIIGLSVVAGAGLLMKKKLVRK